MGTNYYLHTSVCPHCGRGEDDPLHIGKSSAGWVFSLHAHPEEGILDLPDWVCLWSKPDAVIKNEYGDIISPEEMYRCIAERTWKQEISWDDRQLPFGNYIDWEDFHRKNQSEVGPNGLLRHRIGADEYREVKHGEGTWDICFYDFS